MLGFCNREGLPHALRGDFGAIRYLTAGLEDVCKQRFPATRSAISKSSLRNQVGNIADVPPNDSALSQGPDSQRLVARLLDQCDRSEFAYVEYRPTIG